MCCVCCREPVYDEPWLGSIRCQVMRRVGLSCWKASFAGFS
eukprot:COSAG01_NODE_35358_length_533_cov_0.781106_1_plen_40_part_01